ncbi:LamG domain-containing protein [Sulfurospirillum cavolei]|uniref:LamG domain-containing protein n=1 Tax=Sulfurospirillum cavolei TaxID=366522 RepID=UPI0005A99F6A|nr:LamG domain-containing protein [Sulfurospirillum cavolei]
MAGIHNMLLGVGSQFESGGTIISTVDMVDPFGDGSGTELWKFDGNGNGASNSYNLTPINITYSEGIFGQSSVFNGSAYFNLPPLPEAVENITISFWVYFDDNNERMIFDTGVWGLGKGIGIYKNTSNKLVIVFKKSSTLYFSRIVNQPLNLNAFAHIVIVKTTTGLFVYYDNVLVDTYIHNTIISTIEGQTGCIGRQYNYPYYHKGKIDQFRIFNRALTAEEVGVLYTETII